MRNIDMNGSANGSTNGHSPIVPEPIAIVGMGMRLPGKIHSAEALWDLLINKKETSGQIPSSRFNSDGFYSESKMPGSIQTQRGHFLDESDRLDRLDTSLFGMGKAEVEKLDPQQRMLLEVVWECMENAGQVGWKGSKTGVFVGTWGDDWQDFLAKDPQQTGGMLNVSGAGDFAISNRISYEYNLTGPSMTIKAACASSMICLHQASQALREGSCDAAIVAGTNLIITPTQTIAQTEAGVLSPTGQCRSFDASANGYARGEAINAIFIKRLSDAVRDNDPIRAVVRGTAINCDGQSAGISLPNPVAHETMIRRAYEVAGLAGKSLETPFVEAHGTGTPSGDPLELKAISRVFGKGNDTFIGSIKANIGHGEGASGLSSVIKAVLMLEHRTIPPQVNFVTPNPNIPFDEAQLVVPLEPLQWPAGRPERISINSFGITGANAHAIIESAASTGLVRPHVNGHSSSPPLSLFVFSANTSDSLKERAAQIQNYLSDHPGRTKDLSYTLASRRAQLGHRAFCLNDSQDATFASEKVQNPPTINFVFTGQGAQWATMGKELIEHFPQFRNDLTQMSNVLTQLPHPPSWNLLDELLRPETKSQINKAEFAQPLCTALQVALVNLLASLGIAPSGVVGHSSGEIGAAYAAGAITAQEAIVVTYYRGLAVAGAPRTRPGAMAAVGMGRAEASLYLEDGVVVACDNGPNSVTLSGDTEALETVIQQMKADDQDLFVRLLKTDGMAYHSHHMLEVGSAYEEYLRPFVYAKPTSVPFLSTVTGKPASTAPLDAGYWRRNLESPVKFFPGVKALIASQQSQDQLYLEIGPHSALGGPLRQIFKTTSSKSRLTYLPTLLRGKDALECVLQTCGQLYLQAVDLRLEKLSPGGATLTDLPAYPWHHETSHWAESRAVKEWRTRKNPPHELLGARILEGNDIEPTWRKLLRLKDASWLQDHKVLSDVVFPCAGYIAMIGEAVRQITGLEDFSIRRLNISTAMILAEDKTVEVVTSFRPTDYSATTGTDTWYDFSIYSHNGSAWTVHCTGQCKGGRDEELSESPSTYTPKNLPRQIRSPYSIFTNVGLHYGPTFQGLRSVSTLPGARQAAASLELPPVTGSGYALHPTTIDQGLQLLGLASAEGLVYRFGNILLPTGIEHVYVQPSLQNTATLNSRTCATPILDTGDINGEITIANDSGQVLLTAQGCKLSTFEQQTQTLDRDDRIAAARLGWRPHLDFVPLESLMIARPKDLSALQLMEAYVFLAILEIQDRIREGAPYKGHFGKFSRWMEEQVKEGSISGGSRLVADSAEWVNLTAEDRHALIHQVQSQVQSGEFAAVAELVTRLMDNCVDVFNGQTEILDIFVRDNGLTNLYNLTGERVDSTEFFITAGHTNPTMRILEIGAGTGGTTLLALQALTSFNGEPMYGSYTFTDVSSGFFAAAKERFAQYPAIEFKVLDIERDPDSQGFDVGSYDLIIASNVIHATETLNRTLTHVRKLLHPKGRFYLQELTPSAAKMINLIMGPLPGWWLGEADGRGSEPLVSPERWDAELKGAGFEGVECVVHDDPNARDHLGVNIIAKPRAAEAAIGAPRVTLLVPAGQPDVESDSITLVKNALDTRGYHVDICPLGSPVPVYQDVISLLGVDTPFLSDISPDDFASLQQVLGKLGSSKLLWVMGSAQLEPVQNPLHGLALGFMRSIRAELSPSLSTLELHRVDSKVAEVIINVLQHFRERASDVNPDYEYALRHGVVHVGRYHWTKVSEDLAEVRDSSSYPLRLETRRNGGSKVLNWVPIPPTPLGPMDVVISPAYTGLSAPEDSLSSLAGSGTLTAVGSDVHTLSPGDRVMFLAENCLATSITIPAMHAAKIPETLQLEEAASMLLPFSVAIYSLVTVANMRKGQRVLVHDTASAVGLAAIQICQMLEVDVYCTVASEDGREYLVTQCNVPRDHILQTGDASFGPWLMGATAGSGVNAVLVQGSVSAELLSALWKCVGRRGKMIVLGKTDAHALAGLDLFSGNRTLVGVDITTLHDLYPELLSETICLYNHGLIRSITPIHTVALEDRESATASDILSPRGPVGTSVLDIPSATKCLPVLPADPKLSLRSDVAYLLVGGLGGLGQSVSTYLVERGARHLIYLSRTAGESQAHQTFFRELESQGCSVQAIKGNVSSLADVSAAIRNAQLPIAGVLHLGMVLDDHPFMDMAHEDWQRPLQPKVQGTWNLHNSLSETNTTLDFFVMFGSVSGSFGIAHQANYGAANTFQDSFVQYRHSLGLPASVLNIGAMAGVGYVSENRGVEEYFRAAGMPFLSEGDFFNVLHLSMCQQFTDQTRTEASSYINTSQLALGIRSTKPMDDPSNRVLWKHDRRVDIYRNIEATILASTSNGSGTNEDSEDKLATLMMTVRSDPSILTHPDTLPLVTREIGLKIYEFMLKPIDELDVSKALVTLGVDSLVIVEIRNWLRRRLEVETSTLEILNGGTIEMLGRVCVERLSEKYGVVKGE
ncbi:polyketide synthase [Aspergillus ustus]|uniref:Polyketide synthase n=1 Tax=Aspergillus ustus TaxID=40382 RepID=A0A0C1C3K7_ASPUT|nr:polyketide synthase [Aspergillus ustus]